MKPLLFMLVPLLFVQEAPGMAQTPPSPTPDQVAVAQGNNAFAVDLYSQLRQQDGTLNGIHATCDANACMVVTSALAMHADFTTGAVDGRIAGKDRSAVAVASKWLAREEAGATDRR